MQRKGEPEKYKEMVYLILYKGKCKQKEKEGYCNSKKEGKDGRKRLETKWGIKKTKQEGGS